MARIMISVGESSGDRLGAGLVAALRARAPEHEFLGLVGPLLLEQGVSPVGRLEELNVMGIVEVLGALPRIRRVLGRLENALEGVDLLVGVDSPDFNLRLARRARKRGIPVVLLGSPQVWAWRSSRAKWIAENLSEVLCLFPFEPACYTEHGGEAVCIGHPSASMLPVLPKGAQRGLALVPGSRAQELEKLLPVMLRVAARWRERRAGGCVFLARASGLSDHWFEALPEWVEVCTGLQHALADSSVALACSGTASLEIACMDRPQVVIYRMNPVTYAVAKPLLKKNQKIALPNLLADAGVPEFLQRLPEDEILEALVASEASENQRAGRDAVREAVKGGGFELAAERALYWLAHPATG